MTLSRLLRCAGVSTAIHRFYPVSVGNQQFVFWIMASTACFVIVSRNDIPIYEAEVGSVLKKEEAAHLHQFILHAALDIVQDLAWTTSAILMLLHDSRNEDGIKSFFQDVHELYLKILLNPLYLPGSRITSSHFDTKVRALARKYL
ncbi:transport protein particle 20 kDa subunit-like isoform X2 [Ananas comosus]|uniref:Transport protein particle 20 kDa subunit-like isoform X2 n=1 Tax=Ananas comosus TaxID=4615 RepID=A0A6P5EV88_ANACO|nr:transport protein particle 20 kDa subunit-like isoform X2 [Ananas comosus]